MTNDMAWLGFLCSVLAGVAVVSIMAVRSDHRRDLFLSYCTAHGDKYEVCAKAWEEGEMK